MTTRADHRSPALITTPQAVVLLCAALQLLTPLLPQFGVGQPIGDQSDAVRTLITPAGWAFSIWGALYTGATLFAIYQALPAQRGNALLTRIRWPASGAFLGNAVWAAYTQLYGLSAISVAIIAATLLCLLAIFRRLPNGASRLTSGERWLVYLPLSALAAWLTAATIVNIAASLRFYGVEAGDSAPIVGGAVIVVGGVIAALALNRSGGNLPYAAVFLWALAAIYAAGGQAAGAIAAAAAVAAILVVVGTITGTRQHAAT